MPHADPVERQRYNRDYKRANRWRYRRRQKSYDAATHANERSARSGVVGTISPEDAEAILDAGACHWCSEILDYFAAELDHVVPMSRGGPNCPSNIVASCDPCNSRKRSGVHPDQWAEEHEVCVECGQTDRVHAGGGRCARCYRLLSRRRAQTD